jgi:hypothetical protein
MGPAGDICGGARIWLTIDGLLSTNREEMNENKMDLPALSDVGTHQMGSSNRPIRNRSLTEAAYDPIGLLCRGRARGIIVDLARDGHMVRNSQLMGETARQVKKLVRTA